MALTSTSKQISSLKINKVPSEAIYAKMVAQNLINDDELYLISGEADAITGVKGNKETTYRTGNINLTPADIGALPDTTEIPVVPTNISAFENDAGYLTQHQSLTDYPKKTELATVATSGSYNDLKNKPTIPSVGNGTLTIQKNGTSAGTFTANATTNKTINITVPTKVSELTDDVVKGKYLPLAGGTMTGNIDLGVENIKMLSRELGTFSILNGSGLFVEDNSGDKYVKIGVSSYGGLEGAYYSIGDNEDIGDKINGRIYLNNFACQAADDVPESLANVGYVKSQLANSASTTIITWSDDGT